MSMFELLQENAREYGNGPDLTNHDLAHLSDWADGQKSSVGNPDWKKAFALIREGADLLLRRRAMSSWPANEPKVRGSSAMGTYVISTPTGVSSAGAITG